MNSGTQGKSLDEPQLLVVDDDKGIRDLLCRCLAQQGFGVHAAADGQAKEPSLIMGALPAESPAL